jgi:amino acid adenylation domain-containing protein
MSIELESNANYPLSSQQCSVHVENWQEQALVHAVLVEGNSNKVGADLLRTTLDNIIAHHEILRTCFTSIPGLRYPLQHVKASLPSVWKILDAGVDDNVLIQTARALVNPHVGPVIGAAVVESNGHLRWALAAPAYLVDYKSIQELVATCLEIALTGNYEKGLFEVVQYPDYVAWQSELHSSELGKEGASFWEKQTAFLNQQQRLPFAANSLVGEYQIENVVLADAIAMSLDKLARQVNLSLNKLVPALWASFMTRILQTTRLSFELHTDTRTEELQGALGCFVVKLPVSLDFAEDITIGKLQPIADQLEAVTLWQESFNAATYADQLARLGNKRGDIEFAYIALQPLPDQWKIRRIELDPGDSSLQCLYFNEGNKHLLRWQGRARYVPGTLQIWLHQFVTFLASVSRAPEQTLASLSILGSFEQERILRNARTTHQENFPQKKIPATLHGLFETQVQHTPESLAVVCGEHRLTYLDLEQRANALAGRLQQCGVGIEQRIGIYSGRSADTIVAMLAVLKSGAAYVPLDPSYPGKRIDQMINDAGITIVVGTVIDPSLFTDNGLKYIAINEPANTNVIPLQQHLASSQLAYVIYTSGSTGTPKGVMVSHANAVASSLARFNFYQTPVKRFLLLSSPSFDSSVAGIYWTLGQGGTLYIPTEDTHQNPAQIAKLIAQEMISHLLALPSFYKQVLEEIENATGFHCAIVAGEACHSDVVKLHRDKLPATRLVNEYGPTEGTVWSNAFRVDGEWEEGMRIPIGRTVDSLYGYVLDEHLELCPTGLPGEWYLGGDSITRGYIGQPGLTAQKFVADPFNAGGRLYRTGDRVRLRPDGELEYLGRNDNQVKLRGFRIELDEIEAVLRVNKRLRDAAVLVHEDPDLGQRLAGFIVIDGHINDSELQHFRDDLLVHLRQSLPAFMVPALLIPVASLPLMPNGKVDRQALAALVNHGVRPPYVPPTDDIERTLAQVWQGVLKMERIGLKDNFFSLGGHSLLATQLVSRIGQALSVNLPLKDLFETATLAELAERVRNLLDAEQDDIDAMECIMAEAGE